MKIFLKIIGLAVVWFIPALFIIEIIKEFIYDIPVKRIKELEKSVVILEEAFKAKYPEESKEHSYLFDDEEWYVTKTKPLLKDFFVPGAIHTCTYGNTSYYVDNLKQARMQCRSKFMRICCSFIKDVEKRKTNAVYRANEIEELYYDMSFR